MSSSCSGEHQGVDGNEFLNLLRASQMFAAEGTATNDETIGASNKSRNQDEKQADLGELFTPPPETAAPQSSTKISTPPPPAPAPSVLPAPRQDGQVTHKTHKPNSSPPPPRPPAIGGNGRTVSWGTRKVPVKDASALHSLSPSAQVHKRPSIGRQVIPGGGSVEQFGHGSQSDSLSTRETLEASKSQRKVQVTLDEVFSPGPYEQEAENAILRALDLQRMKSRHRQVDTGTSTIFSQIPDNASHDFEFSPMPANSNSTDDHLDEDIQDDASERASSTLHSVQSNQTRPLLQRTRSNRHLRMHSVEQTLFDLTQAMMEMDAPRNSFRAKQNDTSAEEFAKNALRIADQQDNESKKSQGTPTTAELATVPEVDQEFISGRSENGDFGIDENSGEDIEAGNSPSRKRDTRKNNLLKKSIKGSRDRFKEDLEVWNNFFRPRRQQVISYIKAVILYFLVPLIGIAGILFYFAGNPPTGRDDKEEAKTAGASASFILLFCARQIITLSFAFAMQGFVIDFLALGSRVILRLCGPIITLLLVQSKGWPHILFWWCILDFGMLAGDHAFAHHWLYYGPISLFNSNNPSGDIVDNEWYLRSLIVAVSVSVVVAVKRFVVGLYLGRQTFSHYGQQLATVMNKIVLVSKVAALAKSIESNSTDVLNSAKAELVRGVGFVDEENDSNTHRSTEKDDTIDLVIDTDNRDPLTGSLHFEEKMKLMQLLDQWEEPERHEPSSNDIASISAVLRFRKALTFIQARYPFSQAFGLADRRESCVESAQKVYLRLMKDSPTDCLHFERIALLAVSDKGDLDQGLTKDLIKVFRPDRQGFLTMIDFIRSVDSVYKEFRLLEATVENSSKIDRAFENIFNVVFYTVVLTIVLSALGFNPLTLFLSLSSIILAFAFMIGNASAKYFEGLLFILVRRPYGIGDRISVANIESGASLDGVLPWVVQNVTLFETVLTCLPTNETASLSNGSLASSRIVNWARSPQAQFHIILHFPLETPYEKLVVFKTAIEEYIKARPREWRALNGFRVNRVFASQNYLEFFIVIQHREAWQEVGLVLDSKANLYSYCQEVSKQLGLQYQAPRVPVDLRYSGPDITPAMRATADEVGPYPEPGRNRVDSMDVEALTREFQSVARNKHQIRVC